MNERLSNSETLVVYASAPAELFAGSALRGEGQRRCLGGADSDSRPGATTSTAVRPSRGPPAVVGFGWGCNVSVVGSTAADYGLLRRQDREGARGRKLAEPCLGGAKFMWSTRRCSPLAADAAQPWAHRENLNVMVTGPLCWPCLARRSRGLRVKK
jgi:hypothetical protein